MGQYEPDTANELAGVIIDVFRGLEKDGGPPLVEAYKTALAKRVLALYESGITDVDQLRIEVMADSHD